MDQTKTKIHQGHRERVRQRAINEGLSEFQDHELLEYLLFSGIPRKDVNELAHRLINEFGSFAAVLDASYDDLKTVKDMTENAALLLSSLPFIFTRYQLIKSNKKEVLNTRKDIVSYAKTRISFQNTESFLLICLNVKKQIIKSKLYDGGANEIIVPIKDLVSEAVKCGAVYVATAHNHPSGDCAPSVDDFTFFTKLKTALEILGIRYVDNLIVSHKDDLSFYASSQKNGDRLKETSFRGMEIKTNGKPLFDDFPE